MYVLFLNLFSARGLVFLYTSPLALTDIGPTSISINFGETSRLMLADRMVTN